MKWLPLLILAGSSGIKIPTNGESRNPVDITDVVQHIHSTMCGYGHNCGVDGGVSSLVTIDGIPGLTAALQDAGRLPLSTIAASCTSEQVLTSDGGEYYCTVPQTFTGRKVTTYTASGDPAASTWVSDNAPIALSTTCSGVTPTSASSIIAKSAVYDYATTATDGSLCAITGTSVSVPAYRPKFYGWFRSNTDVTFLRVYAGLFESAPGVGTKPLDISAGTHANANDYVAVELDTKLNSGHWICCSSDGTTESCTDIGIGITASTTYKISVDWSTAGTIICDVNGTRLAKTTNLSTQFVALSGYVVHQAQATLDGGTSGAKTGGYTYMSVSQGDPF